MTDIAYLEAYVAISQVKAQYCRGLDTKDWVAYGDVFTDDVEMDTRPAGGTIVQGRDEVLRIVRSAVGSAITAHHVHSPEIKLIDPNTADVIWAMQDRVIYGPDRRSQVQYAGHTGFGHYHERYVRQDGRWRISKTKLTRLHSDNYPHEPTR